MYEHPGLQAGYLRGYQLGSRSALLPPMRDTLCRCLAIVGAILAACFILHVLRFVAISAEARGICAGVVSCLVGARITRGPQARPGRSSGRRRKY